GRAGPPRRAVRQLPHARGAVHLPAGGGPGDPRLGRGRCRDARGRPAGTDDPARAGLWPQGRRTGDPAAGLPRVRGRAARRREAPLAGQARRLPGQGSTRYSDRITSAAFSNEASRAAWSCRLAGSSISLGRWRSTKAAIFSRTWSASPTALTASERSTPAFSTGVHHDSMSSIGGGTGPRSPRRRLTKLCCWLVNWRFASASVSATTTFIASIT